jgi:isopropylmalate/homocitrate/citramalate synthase
MSTYPRRVTIVEVGPRDGLQNEKAIIATPLKVDFINKLTAAGHAVIEAAAFVSPKWVPQMGDASEVFAAIAQKPGVRYTALVPNRAGLDRALAAGVLEIAIFAAASETFSRKNINQSIDESLIAYREVTDAALKSSIRVRAYLSTSFGCPFEGLVAPERVVDLTERLVDLGAFEVAISDTIGIAHPGQVTRLLDMLLSRVPVDRLALHFHDTRGTALSNVLAALGHGVTTFDSSAGGLGGCPYAPGAAGNLATEDLVYMLDGLGIETGVSLTAVLEASRLLENAIGHPLPSRYVQASRSTESTMRSSSSQLTGFTK